MKFRGTESFGLAKKYKLETGMSKVYLAFVIRLLLATSFTLIASSVLLRVLKV